MRTHNLDAKELKSLLLKDGEAKNFNIWKHKCSDCGQEKMCYELFGYYGRNITYLCRKCYCKRNDVLLGEKE